MTMVMSGISPSDISSSLTLQTVLRQGMADTANVELSNVGTPVATATNRMLSSPSSNNYSSRELATTSSDVAFLIAVLSTSSSDAVVASLTSLLQSSAGTSAFQAYTSLAADASGDTTLMALANAITVLGVTVDNLTPTQDPTPTPTGQPLIAALSTGLGSKDLISITAMSVVGVFALVFLLGGVIYVRRRITAKAENPASQFDDPFAEAPAAGKDAEDSEAPTMPSSRVRRGPVYAVGTRVEANYRGRGKWYSGEIATDYGDGTYDIAYDDGDQENGAMEDFIRPPRSRRNRLDAGSASSAMGSGAVSINGGESGGWNNPRAVMGTLGSGVTNAFTFFVPGAQSQPRLTNAPVYDDRSVMSGLSSNSGESGLTGFTSASRGSGMSLPRQKAATMQRPKARRADKLTIEVNSDSD